MSNKKDILVTGANGQLGMEFRAIAKKYPSCNFFFTSREEVSITNNEAIEKYFSLHTFSHCINCAAYTAVDKAETEKDIAFEINATAAGKLSAICKKFKTRFIHISTDYVFDGRGEVPYNESDKTNPINVYGNSKLQGESEVFKSNEQALIIRTSWVYSSYGKNFVKTMIRLMNEKENLDVVNDQFGCPTYAADLAEAVMKIITSTKNLPGVYHYCNEGVTNWYEFALEIKTLIAGNCQVEPIGTAAYPTPAKRPGYSVLDTTKIKYAFGIEIPIWKDSLKRCITLLLSSTPT